MLKSFSIKKTRRTVTLRAFTTIPHLVEHFAPIRLSKLTPEWWRKTPLTIPEADLRRGPPGAPPPSSELAFTVKHCYAIRETLSRAVALRLWADYQVIVMPDGRTYALSPIQAKAGEQHPPSQYPGMLKGWAHHKFVCPWLFHTDEPIHFYYTHPFYHYDDPGRFQVMPGVTEFHWQSHAHANCIFPIGKEKREIAFSCGDPIAYLVPMDEAIVEVKAEQISKEDYDKMIVSRQLSFHHHALNRQHDIRIEPPKKRWRWPWQE